MRRIRLQDLERAFLIGVVLVLSVMLLLGDNARRKDTAKAEKTAEEALKTARAAKAEARAALAAIIAPETLAEARRSVYLVLVDGRPLGTAFVLDRDKGLLATAAHVAEALPLGDKNRSVTILNRTTRAPLTVVGRKVHSGYGAFRQIVEAYQPIRKATSIYDPQAAPVRDLAFDAALIRVNPIDLKTKQNALGPNLRLPPERSLLALGSGAPIAVIGYPYDTLDSGTTPESAISRTERGVIAAMIAPLDSAAEVENPVVANLIIHRLSTAGGSSGSPLINADGEVVGVHTHGVDSVSSNGDSAAQRADVLYDLLSEPREKKRLAEIFLPAWKHTLGFWARAEDVLPWSFYMEYAASDRRPAPTVGSINASAPRPFERAITTHQFGARLDKETIEAADVVRPRSLRRAKAAKSFVIAEAGQYAGEWVSVDRAKNAVLFAYDYSMRQPQAACRLTGYWRKRGDARLAVSRDRASFELFLPAAPEAGVEDYQIIYRREADCDPGRADFFSGRISWGPDAETPTAAVDSGLSRMAQSAQAKLNKAMACALPNGDDACPKTEYLDLK